MLKIVETFSGIGSQAEALKNIKVDHEVSAIVEWEVGALYAYDIIHNGAQQLSDYRFHARESLAEELLKYNISTDGKTLATDRSIRGMPLLQLKALVAAIERTNNKVDVTVVTANDLPIDIDVLTYSFPCQDLSVSGHWHKNEGGIDRNANNRSTLLWQIERLLIDFKKENKKLPTFLLMENVSNILSAKHIDNFNEWQNFLSNLGYVNQVYTLDARDFGVPQSRVRTYMLSVLAEANDINEKVTQFFIENNLENKKISQLKPLSEFLKLDYNNKVYREEAIDSTPAYTPSRQKIFAENQKLAIDRELTDNIFARTITTKQDRNPNSGIIEYKKEILKTGRKYRNLTPRECFLLMGFKEESYDLLMNNNLKIGANRKMLPPYKLIKLAGNSIVVQVLEEIFKQIDEINQMIILSTDTTEEIESTGPVEFKF